MKLPRTLVLLLLLMPGISVSSDSFFSDTNPFTSINDPILIGVDTFRSRLDEIRKEREPLGLILSGGSARAFAHIGVLASMEEAGVRPDFIVADSMGAIVALLYAAGFSPASIEEMLEGTNISSLFAPVMPVRGGLLTANAFRAAIRTLVGAAVDLKDLPIPILIVCEDLPTRRQVHIASGDFATVMVASFALPAFFEPVRFEGLTIIDGGVTNLVPAAIAYQFSSKIIAATALYDPKLDFNNPVVVLARAMDISKTRQAITELEAFRPVVIRCNVEDQSFMAFDRPKELIRRGRASTEEVIGEILALAGGSPPPPLSPVLRGEKHAAMKRFLASRPRGAVDSRAGLELAVTPLLRFADPVEGGSPFEDEELSLGTEFSASFGRSVLSAGVLLHPMEKGFRVWSLEAGLKAAPFNLAMLSSGFSVSGDPDRGEFDLVSSAGLSTILPRVPGTLLYPELWSEGAFRTDETLRGDWEISGGSGLVLPQSGGVQSRLFALRPQLAAGWRFDSLGNSGPVWNARLNGGFPGILELRARTAGRLTVAGPGTLFRNGDGYRGEAVASLPEPGYPLTGVVNLEIAAGSGSGLFTLAELSVIRAVSLAAYLDSAVFGSDFRTPKLIHTAGLSLSADVSFLGLTPLELTGYAGMALDTGHWSFGVRMGRLFAR